jgi:hypothetical protein
MATARNFSISGIYSGYHNLPRNEMSLKSDNVEFVCVIVLAILKMATARKCSMSGINSGHHNLPTYRTMLNFCGIVAAILKMAIGRNFQCRESIRDIIIYPYIKF